MEPSKGEKQSVMEPKTLLDLLPELSGILSKESMVTLTAKKKARNTTVRSCKSEIKPMTMAEMMPQLQGLRVPPTKTTSSSTTAIKKPWISSVKTDSKRINDKTKQSLKNSSVRKVLNFQSKPKLQILDRTPLVERLRTPRFKIPELRVQPEHSRVKNIRISGITSIDQTPNYNSKSKNLIAKLQNKKNSLLVKSDESFSIESNKNKLMLSNTILDTPTSNTSEKSNNDTTFLQKEKEIDELEENIAAMVCDERSLENIEEVSPPASTPFTEYRNVEECLHDSSNFEKSANFNNTIMCFDKTSTALENDKKEEESMIVSLCDLLDKTSVKNIKASSCHELKMLLELEKQLEISLNMLMRVKENHEKALLDVRELIQAKTNKPSLDLNVSTMLTASAQKVVTNNGDVLISQSQTKSILVSKTPTKTISNQGQGLRRTILHKSMPAGLNELMDRKVQVDSFGQSLCPASCIYKELKQTMNFLHTPMKERPQQVVPDTPTVTSHNIQKQLLRLYEN